MTSNSNYTSLAVLATTVFLGILAGTFIVSFWSSQSKIKPRRARHLKNIATAIQKNNIAEMETVLAIYMPLFESNADSRKIIMDCFTLAVYTEKLEIVQLFLDTMGNKQRHIDWWHMNTDTLIMSNACLQLLIDKAPHLVVNSSLLPESTSLLLDFKLIAPCMFRADARRYKKSMVIHRWSWSQSNLLNRFFYILFRQDIVSIVLSCFHFPRLLLVQLVEMVCEPGINCLSLFEIERIILLCEKTSKLT